MGKERLKRNGVDGYALDAGLLLASAAQMSRERVLTGDGFLSEEQKRRYDDFIKRRVEGEPVQYILGRCEFMSLPFYVGRGALIPRPDTETLAEAVIDYVKEMGAERVLDMCCGSGCLGVSVARYTGAFVTAADISLKALEIAEKNAVLNGVQIEFIKSDLFESLEDGKFDAIFSNPPYIRSAEIDFLPKNVRNYEPREALDGGEDGLAFYKRIAEDCRRFLNKDATVFFEIGFDMAADVADILRKTGFYNVSAVKDLTGKYRVVTAKY
jgi:release factor glutamine methyltransferase